MNMNGINQKTLDAGEQTEEILTMEELKEKKVNVLEYLANMMPKPLFRLRYKDGSHGAWDSNYLRVKEDAKFFGARIEVRLYERR